MEVNMDDWQKLQLYMETHAQELRREAEQARLANGDPQGNRRRRGRWILATAILVVLSAWWIF
jgi:hypothetical protein